MGQRKATKRLIKVRLWNRKEALKWRIRFKKDSFSLLMVRNIVYGRVMCSV
jgi:hypothetical protein